MNVLKTSSYFVSNPVFCFLFHIIELALGIFSVYLIVDLTISRVTGELIISFVSIYSALLVY